MMDKAIVDDLNAVSLESLELMALSISNESLTDKGRLFGSSNKVSSFFSNARRFVKKMALAPLGLKEITQSEFNALVDAVSGHGFVNAANVDVTVPEGFTGKWVPYSEQLRSAIHKAVSLQGEVVSFNNTLGRLVQDTTLLGSASGLGHSTTGEVGIDAQMREIGQTFFDGRTHHITRPLGTVIERVQDIAQTHKTLKNVISTEKGISGQSLLRTIDRTMALGEMVSDRIANDEKASKAVVQEAVDIALNLAREVEAYGTLLFRIRQFHLAFKDARKDIKR